VLAVAQQGDTLDAICWRELGGTRRLLEAAYELNRNLADTGPVLVEGTQVVLPDPAPALPRLRETVNLWD